jgi:uncharacterized protein (DUF885 family)
MTDLRPADFDQFVECMYVEMMCEAPELSMLMGVLQVGSAPCPLDRTSMVSDEASTDRHRLLQDIARRLSKFSRESLNPSQVITAEVLDYFLNFAYDGPWIGLKGAQFASHSYLVNPGSGEPSRLLDALTQHHPLRHAQDAEDYLKRADAMADALEHIRRQVELRASRGILLPAPLLRQSIDEMRGLMALDIAANPIYQTFAAKSSLIRGLAPRQRQQLLDSLQDGLRKRILPAYDDLTGTLENHVDSASQKPGLWQLPDGAAYYEFLLQAATTSAISAEQVHDIGIEHVERLRSQILDALRDSGLPDANIIESLRQLEATTRFSPTTPRAALLGRCDSILAEVRAKLPDLFHWLPDAPMTIEAVPTFSEAVRHTAYQPSAEDGSRPACMMINLRDVGADSELDLPTLLYHEAYPGHHLQFSCAQQLRGLPTFRRAVTFDAYIEGWAKYAETIPWQHGINQDPRWHAMRLRRELLSTANLVLDTGIHSKRWSLEQAADYLNSTTGCSAAMSRSIASRSASVPAQLCSYKIGMLQVMELKERFGQARGTEFDIRDFHAAILEHGALPMRVLKGVVGSAMEQGSCAPGSQNIH